MDELNNTLSRFQIKLNEINRDELAKLFAKYRFKTQTKDLCMNAFARVLNNSMSKVKNSKEEVFAVNFEVLEEGKRTRIKKINVTSNRKQENVLQILKILVSFLIENNDQQLSVDSINNYFGHIIRNMRTLCKIKEHDKTILEKNLHLIYNEEDVLDAFEDPPAHKFNLLMFLQDLVIIFISKDYYDFSNFSIIRENFFQYSYKDEMHAESLLAIQANRAKYIGVSKLCCPFCQKFLCLLDISFRGGHDRIKMSLNWRLQLDNVRLNVSNNFHNWLLNLNDNLETILRDGNDGSIYDEAFLLNNIDPSLWYQSNNPNEWFESIDDMHLLSKLMKQNIFFKN